MKALIAAGGSGTRLRPLTFSSNKHLLPVANKPLLLYPIEAIANVGVKEVAVVVNETRPAIENLLGDGSKWSMNITYIKQDQPKGLAHVVKISQDFMAGSPFVFHLGDNIFSQGIKRPFDRFVKSKPDALLTMVKHPENHRLGVPYFDNDGRLIKVVEKPSNPPNKFGVPGLYFFTHHVFKAFNPHDGIKPSARGELEAPDLYSYLITHGYKVEAEEVDGRWLDPGKFDDMLEANRFMLDLASPDRIEAEVDQKSEIKGKVEMGEGSVIRGSKIVGPVVIGQGVEVNNAKLGPYVTIEDNCEVNGATLVNTVLMTGTKINHVDRVIKDSYIGRSTNVWEEKDESVSLFIGDHCQVRLT